MVERIHGKDEVPGSIPGLGSLKNKMNNKQEKRLLRKQEREKQKRAAILKNFFKKNILRFTIIILILLSFWGLYNLAKQPPIQTNISLGADERIKGNLNATTTLIEYLDFQCPACAAYHPLINQIYEKYKDKMKFVVRHFPLTTIHSNAMKAAIAAEAAYNQGKFWEFSDMLFKNQNEWANVFNPNDIFIKYANALNLNIEQFKNDLQNQTGKEKINNDIKSGNAIGVNATPTFFLNNQQIQPRSYDEFINIIENIIK